ncbi:MAG: tRNA-specific adenosine deaminase, partial [Ferruginibacter sp.]|nr:tRNA-specific adenosine deaminase [Ferruginibacter sp.]
GAIYWARPKIVYYANNREDAAGIGFDDSMIYEEMKVEISDRKIPIISLCREEALKIFKEWIKKSNKNMY